MTAISTITEELLKHEQELASSLKSVRDALAQLCKVYGHDMRPDGHDSHYEWDKCHRCGYSERH